MLLKQCCLCLQELLAQPAHPAGFTSGWLELLKHSEVGKHLRTAHPPPFGFGDPKSHDIFSKAAARTASYGAVRHGPECFNWHFPQELDSVVMVIWDGFERVPWRYLDIPSAGLGPNPPPSHVPCTASGSVLLRGTGSDPIL